ncbi:MAG TPA: F0F1 ATP synthase subunit epsilon [Deltaproteobacteria bacterium]|nr:F0F1 ATP synthase subunit epsilon [Deltaproteobacteria bacterium]HOM28208.1 F0F1 ATP synthase subunit epsilon [Deltaproteobacteria bacterium]HPP81011.1 F0F1 ATP synthase subunit epsilon [Deltaproteobacteria bacterium]
MDCKILLPSEVFLHRQADKVVAEGTNGSFCLLPRHIDFVSALVPGLLSLSAQDEQPEYFAVDQGILVKKGDEVLIATRNAIKIPSLGHLKSVVQERFRNLDDKEKAARTAAARLEASIVRRFMELKRYG